MNEVVVDDNAHTPPAPPTPVLKWIRDRIHRDDTTYRLSIHGTEYIRSTRKPLPPKLPRKPRVKKPRVYKPVTMTPEELLKRKVYMVKYRLKRKAEMRRLEAEVLRLKEGSEQRTKDTGTATAAVTVTEGDV